MVEEESKGDATKVANMSSNNQCPTIRFIRSPNQGSALSVAFAQMYEDNSLVDVTLNCGSHQIHAHRLVLSACSPYFRNMFEKQANPFHYPIVNMDNIYVEDLKMVLEFMYKGEVMIPQERLDTVTRCASSLEVDGFDMSQVQ